MDSVCAPPERNALPIPWVSIDFCLDICPRTGVVTADLRTIFKSHGAFPDDVALLRLYDLRLRNIGKIWVMPGDVDSELEGSAEPVHHAVR
ncbi:hypothetical protein [Collimonas sp. OK307]|uniref:hypothetical protein n=1 Tax=Collimonas sp. OK307 TaxID=1801620 RepID=UPI0011137D72|nr:hypothetical protein [Collimonas sp. OK307]